jgi:hypothetical protein
MWLTTRFPPSWTNIHISIGDAVMPASIATLRRMRPGATFSARADRPEE